MMKFLKLNSKKIIIKCILGCVILSIIFGTLSSYIHQDNTKYIAKINEETISLETFKNILNTELNKQIKILGNHFNIKNDYKMFKENIYNYVLSQLVNNILLEQYTKNIGFSLNNNEITNIILNSNLFQENNKFSNKKYQNYLNSVNLTNHEYIELVKKKLNTMNLINTISSTNFILDNEKENIIKLLSQKRTIQKAIFRINSIKNQKINNIEILNYFNKNKNKFYNLKKFKISYIHIKPNESNITCDNKEIKHWYIENLNKYSTQEKRNYSIIQIKTKGEALSILSLLKNGSNFSKIAKEKSIEPISSQKGGEIGWIEINLIPKEIKRANLKYNNQISNIIKFKNEFLIVKLNKIIFKKTKKIDEVYNIIKSEIKHKKALDIYNKLKNKILFLSNKYNNQFDLIQKALAIKPVETIWFNKNSIPKEINHPILKKIIFKQKILNNNQKLNLNSQLIELKKNELFLIRIKNFKEKKLKKLKDVKHAITNLLKYNKAMQKTKEKVKKILFKLNQGNKEILKKENVIFTESETLSRYDHNPIVSRIFSIPNNIKKNKIYTMYQDTNKNFVIAFISKIYNENFSENEKKTIIKYLYKNNIEKIFNCMIKNLHKKSKITYRKIENI